MQFAGQMTNDKFEPIEKPLKVLIQLSEEVLPSPDAVIVTGITPQQTIEAGYTEAQFLERFNKQALKPKTTILGYNSIRFDDEFMRNMLYRNFYDPYEWQWKDDRSRWDLLDVGRMMRALRPEGVNWPVDKEGNSTNRLELLTKENGIEHEDAHDAMADVTATIDLAKLFNKAQPKLFNYLLKMRDKREVTKLVNPDNPQPFVYSSGRYASEYSKTTVAFPITINPHVPTQVLVYDLRRDPHEIKDMSAEEMLKNLTTKFKDRSDDFQKLPIKTLAINKAPAIAPLGVLDDESWKRLGLDLETVKKNIMALKKNDIIAKNALETWEEYGKPQKSAKDVDGQIYEGFLNDKDKNKLVEVRNKNADELADYHPNFIDERLPELLMRYKARNYPSSLSEKEKDLWQKYVKERLQRGMGGSPGLEAYFQAIKRISETRRDDKSKFLLEELQLYGESLVDAEEY